MQAYNRQAQRPIESIVTPGLGTAVGGMHPDACARQMSYAYRTSHLGQRSTPKDLMDASRNQFEMVGREWRSKA